MAESFFRRWARRKAGDEALPTPPAGAAASPPCGPTLNDVGLLHSESDYSAFVASGIDKAVHRAAMKKLFADPHFNLMDGLDIYIDDYNKATPLSAAMLAALQHARTTLEPQLPSPPAGPDGAASAGRAADGGCEDPQTQHEHEGAIANDDETRPAPDDSPAQQASTPASS